MDFVIAVDGTAASGKGTLAEKLAAAYGLPYLDTGLIYRAVGLHLLKAGRDLEDPCAAEAVARSIDLTDLHDPALRSPQSGEAASRVAAHPGVRAALLEAQRTFASQKGGAVLDGRDIGTVIAPCAPAKLFVDAALETRARRRWLQTSAAGSARTEAEILEELRQRDARDMARTAAPLQRAPDAALLDTTNLSIGGAVDAARRLVEAARARWLDNQTAG
jgi:cytidylate kinase